VIAAAGLAAGVLVFIAAGLTWTARLLRIGALDALELAEKVGAPHPSSALDWPELRVRAALDQDLPGEQPLVLMHVEWPAHPEAQAVLLIDFGDRRDQSLQLLGQWCARRASVSTTERAGAVEMRRRQSLERISGILVSEDCVRVSSQTESRPYDQRASSE
jgi:hypothetical protein